MVKYREVIEREGEEQGPIDWSNESALSMPDTWRDAEKHPEKYLFNDGGMESRQVIRLCMYDGWPYWRPMPAVFHESTFGPKYTFFTSYGVNAASMILKKREASGE